MTVRSKILAFYRTTQPELRNKIQLILAGLLLGNGLVWLAVILLSRRYPLLLGLAALAYGLGLRHAVDADHIAAVDNTTRKLVQDGQKPVAVGLFFSLGHSTIVVLLSILIAISTTFVTKNLPEFKSIGSIIGTSASAFFLLALGIINLVIFIDLFKMWRHVTRGGEFSEEHIDDHLHNRGLLARLFKPVLKAVKHSWNMYFVGFLFGLGFDTASEVGILSLSALSSSQGVPIWAVLLLPLIFTAGMALVDTLDGILMLGAYGWAMLNPVRKLYYNLNITLISVIIALFIGTVEGLQVISMQTGLKGGLFALADQIQFEYLGYVIIAAFLVSWLFSFLIYRLKGYHLLESS